MQHISDRTIALFGFAAGALGAAVLAGNAAASLGLVLAASGLAAAALAEIEARQRMARERRNDIPPLRFVDTLSDGPNAA